MSLVIDRELVNDSNKTPRPRLQILEHAVAEGQTVTVRPVVAAAVFSDAAVLTSAAVAAAAAEVEEAGLVVTAIQPLDRDTELLALDVKSDLPVAAPPKKVRRAAKKFALVDPNQAWVMWVAVVLLGGILAANLSSSFTSVYAMAAWIGLPVGVQWLPVVILDVAIVGFSWALMVFASRLADVDSITQDKSIIREKTGRTRIYIAFVTGFSVVANFMHTFTFWKEDLSSAQAITGVVFSASIPLMSLVATEELIRLVFIRRRKIQADSE